MEEEEGKIVGALYMGYDVEDKKIVAKIYFYANEYAKWTWEKVFFALAHETGHAIFDSDENIREEFEKISHKMPWEMWEYVKRNYSDPADWNHELFADGFSAWLTGIRMYCEESKEPGTVADVKGLRNWLS